MTIPPPQRTNTYPLRQRILLRNPFVPLIVRLLVLSFVLAALGLGAYIYRFSAALNASPDLRASAGAPTTTTPGAASTASTYICRQQPSTYMAFIVSALAVLYLLYITWDEYFSKPLGLRDTRAKMRLLFLDLLFIVFSAADLALAFNTLTDVQWACYAGDGASGGGNSLSVDAAQSTCVYNGTLCARQKALCAMLTIALATWTLTFVISVSRCVLCQFTPFLMPPSSLLPPQSSPPALLIPHPHAPGLSSASPDDLSHAPPRPFSVTVTRPSSPRRYLPQKNAQFGYAYISLHTHSRASPALTPPSTRTSQPVSAPPQPLSSFTRKRSRKRTAPSPGASATDVSLTHRRARVT